MQAKIIWGASASGKTTLAQEYVKQGYIEINRDNIRFANGGDWGTYKFTKARENEVTNKWEGQLYTCVRNGEDIVISDTNLNQHKRNTLSKLLEEAGYDVEVIQVGADLTLEQLWKRDSVRINGVGHNVIYKQWLSLQKQIVEQYIPNTNKPKAFILDIDGTIARHEGIRSPFEWSKVGLDIPRQFIIDIAKGLVAQGYKCIVVSGRDGICWQETVNWLDKHDVPDGQLFMRSIGDVRKDTIIKKEIFDNYIRDAYNVVGVLDDRPSVCRTWTAIGIENIIRVGDPYVEF
jgi:predicted kinase